MVQAKQAARAGISDYINNVQADSTYTKYCSSGMTSGATQWACPGSTVSAPTLTNPAFVNSPILVGAWYSDGSTMRGVANGTPSYRYVVNSPNTANPALVLIYSIGQAGTPAGQHVSTTEEAALTVCASGCLYPTIGVSCIKVPTRAVSAKIIAYGAKGGGGGPDAAGGVGAMLTATVPVTAADTLDLYPGQPGQAGNPQLLNLLNLLAGAGGAGGVPLSGPCLFPQTYSPPDLGGGNGALPGGLADVLTDGGGGGGGATMVFDATATTNNMVAVAGGGGGGGAGDLLQFLGGPPGAGGSAGSSHRDRAERPRASSWCFPPHREERAVPGQFRQVRGCAHRRPLPVEQERRLAMPAVKTGISPPISSVRSPVEAEVVAAAIAPRHSAEAAAGPLVASLALPSAREAAAAPAIPMRTMAHVRRPRLFPLPTRRATPPEPARSRSPSLPELAAPTRSSRSPGLFVPPRLRSHRHLSGSLDGSADERGEPVRM